MSAMICESYSKILYHIRTILRETRFFAFIHLYVEKVAKFLENKLQKLSSLQANHYNTDSARAIPKPYNRHKCSGCTDWRNCSQKCSQPGQSLWQVSEWWNSSTSVHLQFNCFVPTERSRRGSFHVRSKYTGPISTNKSQRIRYCLRLWRTLHCKRFGCIVLLCECRKRAHLWRNVRTNEILTEPSNGLQTNDETSSISH